MSVVPNNFIIKRLKLKSSDIGYAFESYVLIFYHSIVDTLVVPRYTSVERIRPVLIITENCTDTENSVIIWV